MAAERQTKKIHNNGNIQKKTIVTREFGKKIIPYLGLVFVVILFGFLTEGRSISPGNLKLIIKQASILMIGSVGATFTVAHGTFDLSPGGIVALSALAGGLVGNVNPWLMLPTCIIAAVLCSWAVVGIHISLQIPAFIGAIVLMFVGQGVIGSVSTMAQVRLPEIFADLDTPLFYFTVLIAVVIIGYVLLEYTKIGKYNKIIGSSNSAALVSGIEINKYKWLAFTVGGCCYGICAFLTMVRAGAISASTGNGFEMMIMIALVLGGTSLNGGTSVKIWGAITGCLIYYILENGLLMMNAQGYIMELIKGMIFLLAVTFSYDRKAGNNIA